MMLSVIIPVYNAEAYLRKCVESVCCLSCDKEVILVDDGSKDGSGVLCDELAKEHACVSVIHQENQGVSAARNRGLEVAKGGKVWFVDADDYVINSAEQQDCTISHECLLTVLGFVWDEKGEAKSYGASKDEVPYNLWRCWFDRNAIEKYKLRFTIVRKYAEDQEFILRFLLATNAKENDSVSAVDNPIYYYTMRPGSAMGRKGLKQKKVSDVGAVLVSFSCNAFTSGMLTKKWVWREIKRLTKTLWVTATR